MPTNPKTNIGKLIGEIPALDIKRNTVSRVNEVIGEDVIKEMITSVAVWYTVEESLLVNNVITQVPVPHKVEILL